MRTHESQANEDDVARDIGDEDMVDAKNARRVDRSRDDGEQDQDHPSGESLRRDSEHRLRERRRGIREMLLNHHEYEVEKREHTSGKPAENSEPNIAQIRGADPIVGRESAGAI